MVFHYKQNKYDLNDGLCHFTQKTAEIFIF